MHRLYTLGAGDASKAEDASSYIGKNSMSDTIAFWVSAMMNSAIVMADNKSLVVDMIYILGVIARVLTGP